jgi:hypothetical protein
LLTGTRVLAYWYKSTCLLVQKVVLTGTKALEAYTHSHAKSREGGAEEAVDVVDAAVGARPAVSRVDGSFSDAVNVTYRITGDNGFRSLNGSGGVFPTQTYLLTGTKVLASWYRNK